MANIASVLKSEISRLSNKAARQHVAPVQVTASQLRKQVSALKKQVQALSREVAAMKRSAERSAPITESIDDKNLRFTAKGVRSMRSRLELSAADYGRLLNVGAQTVYSWESERSKPRRAQMQAITALRKIGKREARARLAEAAAG
jgi:DNA-binding transcriptional regulator YiaG